MGFYHQKLVTSSKNIPSHNEDLPDGIAEAFIEWAKREDLSFWR